MRSKHANYTARLFVSDRNKYWNGNGLNWPLKFRSKVLLLKLCNALQSLFDLITEINGQFLIISNGVIAVITFFAKL